MAVVRVEVKSPLSFKSAGVLGRPYLVYPIEVQSSSTAGSASRRYTDFELLRSRLNAIYWYCVIPPLPEKETMLENLGVFDAPGYQERIGVTRREEFKQFLLHVYQHPTFSKDPVLRQFLNDQDWQGISSVPQPVPSFLDTNSFSGITQHFFKKASPQKEIKLVTSSVEVQRQYLDTLRKQFQLSISHRKEGWAALKRFGEDFQALGEIEGSASRSLCNSINGVCAKIAVSSDLDLMKEEKLLATLNFWHNMCDAVLETCRNISAAEAHYRNALEQIETMKNSPIKANTDINYVESLRHLEKERDVLHPILKDAELLYRNHLKIFQEEMNADLNTYIIRYDALQNYNLNFVRSATAEEAR